MNFFDRLTNVLKQDDRFFTQDGTLLRNSVYEAGMKMDKKLLKLLYDDEETRKRFFTEVDDGMSVFDKVGFGWVISNRQLLPDSFTRFKNKVGLADADGNLLSTSNDVELIFPYKDCILEGGQTQDDQKRTEIFYNESLAPDEVDRLLYPKVFTNAVRYKADGEEETVTAFSEDDNLIIKGNNLLAISSILPRYENKVKCVYLDPPYNPNSNANTFVYNNTFNRSTWLTFMKNRLEIAKKFLAPDGVMIVAIDKNEQPRLQILIEELFPEYEVDCINIVHNPRGTMGTNFSYNHENAIFVTPKGIKTIGERKLPEEEISWSPLRNWGGESLRSDAKNCFYPIIVEDEKIVGFGDVCDNNFHPEAQTEKHGNQYYVYPIDSKGVERKWRYARQTVESILDILRVKKLKEGYDIEIGKNYGAYKTVWTDPKFDASTNGTQLLKKINPDSKFSYPKSLYTVKECLYAVTGNDKDALILDFFGGSGTTGHAVMDLNKDDNGNRHFILVEQMDYIKSETLKRNVAVMRQNRNSSPITYFELVKLNQNYVDAIEKAETDEEVSSLLDEIIKTDFISFKVNPKDINAEKDDFEALSLEEKKAFLMEILDKNQLYVNLCDIDDETFGIGENDNAFTKSFYGRK